MKKTIIFDFDGTIADTLGSVVRIVTCMQTILDTKKLQKKTSIPAGKKPREILSFLGLSIFKLPSWTRKIHSEMNKEISHLEPTVNILPILSELYEKDHVQMGILTSNTQENVKKFLFKNRLEFFDFIHTGKSVFGKIHVINKILKQQNVDQRYTFYVCDEIRDIEAAKKSGIMSIAVTWGYNTKEACKKNVRIF
ncbi:HAD hydrolase-like protein [Nitrosopumilus sp.]|uniref:HAD hydrolase-like protein n=1 Tax=Nitrosopumilus sp. TaxID=2024843 RepID=UPI0029313F53|nr:HAD hydrolase-like protein [Nitrosopumilus sp.]